MSNHLHLIIAKEKEPALSDILRDFKKYTPSQIIKSIKEESESRRFPNKSFGCFEVYAFTFYFE